MATWAPFKEKAYLYLFMIFSSLYYGFAKMPEPAALGMQKVNLNPIFLADNPIEIRGADSALLLIFAPLFF